MTTQVQPKSKTVTANGINLHYLDWGAEGRPPVVLLHGLRGHANVWEDVALALCNDYHVYSVDQRGRGDTDHAPGGDYSTDAFVADLAGFVDAIGLDKFILFGHSMGGRNSMAFAGQLFRPSGAPVHRGHRPPHRAGRRQSYHRRAA